MENVRFVLPSFLITKVWEVAGINSYKPNLDYVRFIDGYLCATDGYIALKQCLKTIHNLNDDVINFVNGKSIKTSDFGNIDPTNKSNMWYFYDDRIVFKQTKKNGSAAQHTLLFVCDELSGKMPCFERLWEKYNEKNEVMNTNSEIESPFLNLDLLNKAKDALFDGEVLSPKKKGVKIKLIRLIDAYVVFAGHFKPEDQKMVIMASK